MKMRTQLVLLTKGPIATAEAVQEISAKRVPVQTLKQAWAGMRPRQRQRDSCRHATPARHLRCQRSCLRGSAGNSHARKHQQKLALKTQTTMLSSLRHLRAAAAATAAQCSICNTQH